MTLVRQLASLEAIGLIGLVRAQPELEYLFRHELVHEVAHDSLVKTDRRRLHRAAGEVIERLYPDRLDSPEIAPLLARHFGEAGEAGQARRYYTLAGRAAARANANAEAARYFDLALQAAQTDNAPGDSLVELHLLRGRALELSAQDAAAIANYEDLGAWATVHGDRPAELAALTAQATALLKPSLMQNTEAGRALAERALDLARTLGDGTAEARALWGLMTYFQATWQLTDALRYGERALTLARKVNDRELLAYVLTDIQTVLFAAGHMDRGRAALAEARQIWRDLGIQNMLADNLSSTAVTHILAGEYDAALALSDEAGRISAAIGNLWNQAYAGYMIDLVHFDLGDTGRAIAVARESARLAEQAGFAAGLIQSEVELALIYAYLGAADEAYGALGRAGDHSSQMLSSAETLILIHMQATLAYMHLTFGDVAAAQAVYENIPARDQSSVFQRAYFWVIDLIDAELAIAAGNYMQAVRITDETFALSQQIKIRLFTLDLLHCKARALAALGRGDEARVTLEEARTLGRDLGSRRLLWKILGDLAALLAAEGHEAEARHLRREAREIVDYIAGHTGADNLRASFLRRPDVLALMLA